MRHYLGIDGGGTKTHFALADENGQILANYITGSCHLNQLENINALEILFLQALQGLLTPLSLTTEDVEHTCIGFPGYGAFPTQEADLHRLFHRLFGSKYHCTNDVHIAWAANHLGLEGIHVVSGTGSIAYGKSKTNAQVTSGGWGPVLGDEGSGFWLGLKAISLFCKQADGRLPKDDYYGAFKKAAGLLTDFDIIEKVRSVAGVDRPYVASFSKPLYEAIHYNDFAMNAFVQAGEELAGLCLPIAHQLQLEVERIPVSISGSIFEHCPVVQESFKNALSLYTQPFECLPLKHTPIQGAIRLAINGKTL